MQRPNYQLSVNAALVLGYGTDHQAVVKGLNKMKPPGLTRDVTSVSEFRRDFDLEFTTTGKISRITCSGNMVVTDDDGQDRLKEHLKQNDMVQDARLYLDYDDFVTVDMANDPAAAWQVSKYDPGEADKNGVFPISVEIVPAGLYATFKKHLAGDGIAFVATGNKLTDADAGFVSAGFKVGQTLIVEGSTSNDGQYLIKTVAAGELTLDSAVKVVVDEAAGPEITIHGGTL